MKINGTDIIRYGAKQFKVTYGHQELKYDSEWDPGSILPYIGVCRPGFKQISVTIVMKGKTRTDILRNRSDLISALAQPAILELDKCEHFFFGSLKSHSETEINPRRWHNMDLVFECYEYGEDVVQEGTEEINMMNPGNAPSPCIVKITPGISASSIKLTGICRDPFTGEDLEVEIEDVENGEVIILDGITGLITQDGDLKEADIWALPTLKPGANQITCNNRLMDLEVTVRPVYM